MPEFIVEYIHQDGRKLKESLQAVGQAQLTHTLKKKKCWPLSIREKNAKSKIRKIKVPFNDLLQLLESLQMQIEAGINADLAIKLLMDEYPEGNMKYMLTEIYASIQQGNTISSAFSLFPRVFPSHVIAIIAAGERSAQLPETLNSIYKNLTTLKDIKRTMTRALIYPSVVLLAAISLVSFLVGYVMPQFAEIIRSAGSQLPGLTLGLINVGTFFKSYWIAVIALCLAIPILLYVLRLTKPSRFLLDKLALRIPLIGPILKTLLTARIASNFQLLYQSGINVPECLRMCSHIVGNLAYADVLEGTVRDLEEGSTLAGSMKSSNYFPSLVCLNIKSGEESGQIDKAFERIASFYTKKAKDHIAYLLTLFEPVLIITLAVIVGTIVLSFILPLFSMMTLIQANS